MFRWKSPYISDTTEIMLPPESNHKSPWKRFFLNLSLVILLIISALFAGIYAGNSKTYINTEPHLLSARTMQRNLC